MMHSAGSEWHVVDFHAHFPIAEDDFLAPYRQDYIRQYGPGKWQRIAEDSEGLQREWQHAWGFPTPEPAGGDWMKVAARWRAETELHSLKAVAFVSGGGNELLSRIVAQYPERFIGFAHHDPESPGAAAELARAVDELGLRGYKVFAPLLKTPLSSTELFPIWQAAEDREVPVLIHFGILGGAGGIGNAININPLALHDAAKAFPGVPFVIPHFGCGYVRELLQLCWACPNIHVDTSGNNEWMRWMPEELDLNTLFRRFYESVGPRRIIFGSDSSWFPRGFAQRYLLDQRRACEQLRLPSDAILDIFSRNASRLLRLTGEAG